MYHSLASTSTAPTEPSCKQLPVADVVDHLQDGLKIYNMVYVPLSQKERYSREKMESLLSIK
jgi:hypothetical protein